MWKAVVATAAQELVDRLVQLEGRLDREDEESAFACLSAAMDDCLTQLAGTGLWGRANETPSIELWRAAGQLLERGWMQHRARTKPRGYAGDYQLLGRMVRNRLCEDRLGRLFDKYFQSLAAPIAVRNRSAIVRNWVIERMRGGDRPQKVVIVGSGPAFDIEEGVQALSPDQRAHLRVSLLDYDPLALDDAQARIGPLLPEGNLTTEAAGLFRISERPKMASWLDGADLIVSVGMFDYLDDSQSARMLSTFWQRAAPGGEVGVFNFSPRNTSRAYMEWIGNWYLIYRDETEMRQMAAAAGIPPELVEQGSEPLEADLFIRIRKPR